MKNYKLSDETRTTPSGTVLHRIVATTTFTVACGLTINDGDVGGWIEKESNLSGNAWVSDNAQVFGGALIQGNAMVYGNAKVFGIAWVSANALVYGNARVSGMAQVNSNAQVYGSAEVYDRTKVSDNARVFGSAQVSDNAQVYGNAKVSGYTQVSDNARVYGNAKVSGFAKVRDNVQVSDNAKVSGEAIVRGDAKIMNASDYIVFKNDWSSNRYFTWTKSNDMWDVGCFYGTGDELIKKAYADSEDSGKHYEACVKLVKTL